MLSFQVIAGDGRCNAQCPFCISKITTTPAEKGKLCTPQVNWHNFHKAARLAKSYGATSAVITGKGEPTLYPNQITKYVRALDYHEFSLIDLQTNGTIFQSSLYKNSVFLEDWYNHGLTTIAISAVSIHEDENQQVMFGGKGHYPNLAETVRLLRSYGFMIRLSIVGLKGCVDTVDKIKECLDYCKQHDIKQFTWREVYGSDMSPTEGDIVGIKAYVMEHGTLVKPFGNGGLVYDLNGQNICLTKCLEPDKGDGMQNVIFFPNGDVYTRWECPGSIILQGD